MLESSSVLSTDLLRACFARPWRHHGAQTRPSQYKSIHVEREKFRTSI